MTQTFLEQRNLKVMEKTDFDLGDKLQNIRIIRWCQNLSFLVWDSNSSFFYR